MCNVNILLEIKGTVSDFLKDLKESICKLGLDVILTDFFFPHLTYFIGMALTTEGLLQECSKKDQEK